ncbi:P-loop containing nucleoside triphosphate hydrolase protein [Flammula alnicola]|nr:P-loop containing nucleoside triphosphate hydrolase protein [Flammula alnicola]
MTIDSEEPLVHESEKKKKNKKKHADEGELMSVDPEVPAPEESEKKKRKKRKREQQEDEATAASTVFPCTLQSCISRLQTLHKMAASPADAAAFLEKHSITITAPPGVPSVTPVISFAQLDVPAELSASFAGFKEPTPIQACTWPPALEGRDVVGIAETGSGKTLAFGIPALCRIINSSSPKSSSKSSKSTVSTLVVAPTRELAIQTHETLSALGKPFGIASVAVFGGVPKDPQVRMLKNANKAKDGMTTRIIVGTPGRILDLMQEGACDLSEVNYLVLDEADRMLDKGFENDIRNIISATKPAADRQTMMFSATWPEAVRRLASTFQRDPVRVTVGSDDLTANSRVEQSVEVFDDSRSKDQRLLSVLRSLAHKKTTTNGVADRGSSFLHYVAARGLDIPNVGAVINYTFPLTIEDYIHRIGRTGRGGKSGKSITALAGEFARVLREGNFDYEALKKFPMTIKKKEHSAYGAFFRDDIPVPRALRRLCSDTY